jgi:serine/threonine protein kinase
MLSVLQDKVQFPTIKVSLGRQVGEGAFSFVYEAREVGTNATGRRFAVKKLLCQSQEQVADAEREIAVLRKLHVVSHTNLLPLLDTTSATTKAGHLEYYLLLPLYYGKNRRLGCWLSGKVEAKH